MFVQKKNISQLKMLLSCSKNGFLAVKRSTIEICYTCQPSDSMTLWSNEMRMLCAEVTTVHKPYGDFGVYPYNFLISGCGPRTYTYAPNLLFIHQMTPFRSCQVFLFRSVYIGSVIVGHCFHFWGIYRPTPITF